METYKATTGRYLDYTQWHKIAVRIQDSQSLIRIFVDDKMLKVDPFLQTFESYPSDAELRLAQVFEVFLENTGSITRRFKVSYLLHRIDQPVEFGFPIKVAIL